MTSTLQSSKWLHCPVSKPQAKQRLFCFHYSGGGGSAFNRFGKDLPDSIEVVAIQLPGREGRLFEPPFRSLTPLLEAVTAELLPHLTDKPFLFFGHSMGAIVSFELSRHLKSKHNLEPKHLFVSGFPGAHTYTVDNPYHQQSDPDLLNSLKEMGGTSNEILENEELMRLVLPTIRADFEVCETYQYAEGVKLDCPITAFGGWQDEMLSEQGMNAWQELTDGACEVLMFEGGHFFLFDEAAHQTIMKKIVACSA